MEGKKEASLFGNEILYFDNCSIETSILQQARLNPNKIAVIDKQERVTYAQLIQEALSIAGYIVKKCGYFQRVGVCMKRSSKFISAVLGVLFSGGSYVPISPDGPEERNTYILKDCSCRLIIASENIQSKKIGLIHDNYNHVISFEEIEKDDVLKDIPTEKDKPAYIIYTSGSTGVPKGVEVSRRAINNVLRWMLEKFDVSEEDIVALKTLCSFTDSVWEILLPLIAGAKVKVISDDESRDMGALCKCMEDVTITQFVPIMLRVFTEYVSTKGISNSLSHLKWIINSAGELDKTVAHRLNQILPCAKLCNAYGMTEAAIFSSYYDFDANNHLDRLPIGKPIWNTQIYIIDNENRICNENEMGEICIAGKGIANGYINLEQITLEKFKVLPEIRSLVYMTGDLGKINSDGQMIYCGRKDEQVKVHGCRVEVSEVEIQIKESVGDSCNITVISHMLENKDNELICFYTDYLLDKRELRQRLAKKIPRYMIPNEIIYLPTFPLNQNGKIDKLTLNKIWAKDRVTGQEQLQFIGEQLRCVIRQILGKEHISIKETFNDLGIDSLSTIQICAMLDLAGIRLSSTDFSLEDTVESVIPTIIERGGNNIGKKY